MAPVAGRTKRRAVEEAPTGPLRRPWALFLLVGLITFCVFVPSLKNGFVDWDDDKNLLNNLSYRGLGAAQLTWMWTTFHLGPYQPLSWMTYGLDYAIWGMRPFGYHLTSVLLHALGAALFAAVASRLFLLGREDRGARLPGPIQERRGALCVGAIHKPSDDESPGENSRSRGGTHGGSSRWLPERADVGQSRSLRGAVLEASSLRSLRAASAFGLLAGLIWAIHPLRVEAVSWATERREVLCGVFSLLALLSYLAGRRWYVTCLATLAALLSKGTAVVLPALFVLIDTYGSAPPTAGQWIAAALRSLRRHAVLFGLSAVFEVLAVIGQRQAEAVATLEHVGVLDRLLLLGHSLGFYALKTIWPSGLAPIYEMSSDLSSVRLAGSVSAVVLLGALAAGVVLLARRPALLPLLLAYVALVAPVGGLMQVGMQVAADRYAYAAGWALSLLAASGIWWGLGALRSGMASEDRAAVDPWMAARAAVDPAMADRASDLAEANRGVDPAAADRAADRAEANRGVDPAAADRAADRAEGYPGVGRPATADRASALSEVNRAAGRRERADHAAAKRSRMKRTAENRSLASQSPEEQPREHHSGRLPPAAPLLAAVLVSVPLAWSTVRLQGIWRDSESLWTHQLEAYPNTALAHYSLARLRVTRDRGAEADSWAEPHFREAIRLQPDRPDAYRGLANVLRRTSRLEEAIKVYRDGLRLSPRNGPLLYGLALAYWEQGSRQESIRTLRDLAALPPETADSHLVLARALAANGDASGAISEYERAIAAPTDAPAIAPMELAWLLATHPEARVRDGARAVDLARRAAELGRQLAEHGGLALRSGLEPRLVRTLAAALAEKGDFAGAAATLHGGAGVLTAESKVEMDEWLQRFARREPIRAAPRFP